DNNTQNDHKGDQLGPKAFSEGVEKPDGYDKGNQHPHDRSQEDKADDLQYRAGGDCLEAGMRDRRARETAYQGMGGTGRNAEPPGQEVPGDGGDQTGQNNRKGDKGFSGSGGPLPYSFGHGVSHTVIFENKIGRKVKECRPQ